MNTNEAIVLLEQVNRLDSFNEPQTNAIASLLRERVRRFRVENVGIIGNEIAAYITPGYEVYPINRR